MRLDVSAIDRRLLQAVARARRPWLDPIVRTYSRTGDYGVGWVALGGALAVVRGEPSLAAITAAAVWGTLGANYAIKRAARRERPEAVGVPALIRAPASSSFPSSHAAMSVVAVTTLGRFVPTALPALAGAGAAMIVSRVYLAVHHPSDVIAGALVGAAASVVVGAATR